MGWLPLAVSISERPSLESSGRRGLFTKARAGRGFLKFGEDGYVSGRRQWSSWYPASGHWSSLLVWCRALPAAILTFNEATPCQLIGGFGVDANHRNWKNDELKRVLDAFIDQAGMTLFRVVFDEANRETNNDNDVLAVPRRLVPLQFDAVPGTAYYIEYSESLITTVWRCFGRVAADKLDGLAYTDRTRFAILGAGFVAPCILKVIYCGRRV